MGFHTPTHCHCGRNRDGSDHNYRDALREAEQVRDFALGTADLLRLGLARSLAQCDDLRIKLAQECQATGILQASLRNVTDRLENATRIIAWYQDNDFNAEAPPY